MRSDNPTRLSGPLHKSAFISGMQNPGVKILIILEVSSTTVSTRDSIHSELSPSSAVSVSSSTSHFFRMLKIVFVLNPARTNCRKILAVCF